MGYDDDEEVDLGYTVGWIICGWAGLISLNFLSYYARGSITLRTSPHYDTRESWMDITASPPKRKTTTTQKKI